MHNALSPYLSLLRVSISLLIAWFAADRADALCSMQPQCNCTFLEPPNDGLRAVFCELSKRKRLDLESTALPENLAKVEIAGGKELRLGPAVFARLPFLERVVLRNIPKVFVQKGSFANMTTNKTTRFEFVNFSSLVLEEQSWRNPRGPVSVLISKVATVIVQRAAFARLSDLTVSAVTKLELQDEAFHIENPKNTLDVPSTTITLDNVVMETLGRSTFHSMATEVRITGSEIKRVKSDAFNAIHLGTIHIENTTLHKLESGAFSERTLVGTLRLSHVKIHEISSNALLSGLSHLIIDHCKIGTVHGGGINITVASVSLTNNLFGRVMKKGFSLQHWNSASIVKNTFKCLESSAFSAPFQSPAKKPASGPEYNFSGNTFSEVTSDAFDFNLTEELTVDIQNNFFKSCRCDMESGVKSVLTGIETAREAVFDSGSCYVDQKMSECFQLPLGFVYILNFTEQVCATKDEQILCRGGQRDAAIPPHIPSITSAVDIMFVEDFERDKKVLGSVFVIAVSGMLIMMMMSGFMWLRRNGYCTKARLMLLPSTNSLINLLARVFSASAMTPTGSAHSISRLSVHEYAELQRKIEEGNSEEDVPLEDKATQTLPEELTQELLQSLREKLDDPDNYKEARDMIEHLYDLIKVEESCNRNYHNDSTSINMEELEERAENLYDVIQPKKKAEPQTKATKNFVSTGTRAPSPDKLLPLAGEAKRQYPTLMCEYVEPKDRRMHLYTELPPAGGDAAPGPPAASMLCDYGEPTDTKVHIYTELPTTNINNNNKMANRPLPSKPDQQHSTGGTPSTSK